MNLKTVVTRNQSTPNFQIIRKIQAHVRVRIRRLRDKSFLVNLARFFFSCNHRFEVRPFALLPTKSLCNNHLLLSALIYSSMNLIQSKYGKGKNLSYQFKPLYYQKNFALVMQTQNNCPMRFLGVYLSLININDT